ASDWSSDVCSSDLSVTFPNRVRRSISFQSFFYGDRSLDRPRVYVQAEFLPNQLRQLARSNGLASDEVFLNKLQYWALELVRAAWPPLLRYEPSDPRF